MVQSPAKPITLEEFLKLPETQPASEYVDGQIIQKPMPQGKHSTIQTELSTTIHGVLNRNKLREPFQNCVVHLVGVQRFQMYLCLPGREFCVTKMVKLLISFQ